MLALEVLDEVDEQTSLPGELHLGADAVVLEVLVEHLGRLRLGWCGMVEPCLHHLLVDDVGLIALIVGLCDVVGVHVLARDEQRLVFLSHCLLEGIDKRSGLGHNDIVPLGTAEDEIDIDVVGTVVESR